MIQKCTYIYWSYTNYTAVVRADTVVLPLTAVLSVPPRHCWFRIFVGGMFPILSFFFRIRLPPFQRRLSTYYAFVFFFYGAIIVSTRLNYRIPTYSLVYTVVLGIDYYETGSPLGAELRRPSFTLTLSFNFTSLFLFLFFVLSCLLLLLLLFHLPSDNVQRLFQSSTQTCSSSI